VTIQMKKMKLALPIVVLFAVAACSSPQESEETTEATTEVEVVEENLDDHADDIEAETQDMMHDVDSLLEGI